jgi:protoporphyrinogen oxidase
METFLTENKQDIRISFSPKSALKVLDCLLKLNFKRHAENFAASLWEKPKAKKKQKTAKRQNSPSRNEKRQTFVTGNFRIYARTGFAFLIKMMRDQ